MNYNNEFELAKKAAKKAGEIILSGYSRLNTISVKENKSLVTEVDRDSEKEIISIIERESSYKILSEETRSTLKDEITFWAIDPLDGTTNFIRRIPIFAVSISLIVEGEPVIGVVFNPFTNELSSAMKNSGSFYNDKRVSCSTNAEIVFANSGYRIEHKKAFAENVSKLNDFYVRKLGSTAYELATIARGGADAFIAWGDELWDHAAGIILVREAGGVVTDWQGNYWSTNENHVFASNQTIREELLNIIK